MAQISEHINYSNKKNHSYYHIGKIIVNLGNNKCKKQERLHIPYQAYSETFINEYS